MVRNIKTKPCGAGRGRFPEGVLELGLEAWEGSREREAPRGGQSTEKGREEEEYLVYFQSLRKFCDTGKVFSENTLRTICLACSLLQFRRSCGLCFWLGLFSPVTECYPDELIESKNIWPVSWRPCLPVTLSQTHFYYLILFDSI